MDPIEGTNLRVTDVLKYLLYFVIYLIVKMLKINVFIRLFYNRIVLFVVPFSYLFICRFGDCHTVLSAFSRRYYDLINPYRGMVVIDIGAHIGTFAIRYGKKLRSSGIVIAIEPEPSNYELLKLNLRLNKLYNVYALPIACSSYTGKTVLYLHGFTGHSLVYRSDRYVYVQQYTLDDLYRALSRVLKVRKIDLIKINAEGAEVNILLGAQQALIYTRALVIAAHHDPDQPALVSKILESKGFHCRIIYRKGNTLVLAISKA